MMVHVGTGILGFVKDDGGRAAAGFKGSAADCVTRAIAIASGRDYREVYRTVARMNKEYGNTRSARNGTPNTVFYRALLHFGFVKVKRGRGPWPTYTEVARKHPVAIVTTRKHAAAIVNGNLRDTFDDRTYVWEDGYGEIEDRERKAGQVWVPA